MKRTIILFLLLITLINAIDIETIFTDTSNNYSEFENDVQSISEHKGGISSLIFSPNGKYLASGSYDKTIKIWEVKTSKKILEISGNELYRCLDFSPDNKFIAVGSLDNQIKIFDLSDGSIIYLLEGHINAVTSLDFSPNGKLLASSSDDGTVRLWDILTEEEIGCFPEYSSCVKDVSFSPNGKYLASGSWRTEESDDEFNDYGEIKIWDIKTGEEVQAFSTPKSCVYSLSYSPDGKYLAGGGGRYDEEFNYYGEIKIWDVKTGERIKLFSVPDYSVNSISYSPDGKYLVSGHDDSSLKIWEVSTGKQIKTIFGNTASISSVSYSPNGKYLASSSWDYEGGIIKIWEIRHIPSNQ